MLSADIGVEGLGTCGGLDYRGGGWEYVKKVGGRWGIVMVVAWAIIWIDRFCFFCYLILSVFAGCDAESIRPVGNVTSILCSSLQSTTALNPFV